MKRLGWIAAGLALGLSGPAAAMIDVPPGPPESMCVIHLSDVRHAPRFEDYPARPWHAVRYPRPVLDTQEKRLFRTMLRHAATEGPNFAGHYRIAVWGCGMSCTSAAIIDEASGRVIEHPDLGVISTERVNDGDAEYNGLHFRRDSRLLIALGAPHEDDDREGVYFYEWTGAKLKLLRFVPRLQACHPEPE